MRKWWQEEMRALEMKMQGFEQQGGLCRGGALNRREIVEERCCARQTIFYRS